MSIMVLRQLNDTDADLALSASENAIIGAALTTFEDGETVDLLWCQSCDTDYSRLVANAAKDDRVPAKLHRTTEEGE